MTDETRAEEAPATENQAEAVPTSEQETTQSTEVVEDAPTQEVPQTTETADLQLPEGTKDRTAEQFDKLKSQLRDERLRREEAEILSQQYQYSQYSQTQTSAAKPLYDQNTGYVDVQELEKMRTTSTKAESRAVKAEKKLEKFIQDQQEREAFSSYPELNKKGKDFDPELNVLVRGVLTDSIMNPKDYGGRELTLKEAADRIKSLSNKELAKAEQLGAEKAVKQLTPKEQASLEATGRSDRREPEVDYATLRRRSQRGDRSAIIERLRSLG